MNESKVRMLSDQNEKTIAAIGKYREEIGFIQKENDKYEEDLVFLNKETEKLKSSIEEKESYAEGLCNSKS